MMQADKGLPLSAASDLYGLSISLLPMWYKLGRQFPTLSSAITFIETEIRSGKMFHLNKERSRSEKEQYKNKWNQGEWNENKYNEGYIKEREYIG